MRMVRDSISVFYGNLLKTSVFTLEYARYVIRDRAIPDVAYDALQSLLLISFLLYYRASLKNSSF